MRRCPETVVSVLDDRVRIAQFWQAVEIFSPQQLPRRDSRKRIIDIQPRRPMPWEPDFGLPKAKEGYVWRHEVYGGVYPLSRVRDVLVKAYGQDREGDSPPKGDSALFACAIDEVGFLVADSMVVSACAWGAGRVSQGKSPLGDLNADTRRYTDSLGGQAKIRAGVRVLAGAICGAVPDGVAGAVGAAVGAALTPLGPLGAGIAATTGSAAKTLAELAMKRPGDAGQQPFGEPGSANQEDPETRLDVAAITSTDLHDFIAWLAAQLCVQEDLRPRYVRVWSHQVKEGRAEENGAQPFLNSFLVDDLALVTDALRAGNVGGALAGYLTSDSRIDKSLRTDVQRHPQLVLDGCRPELIPLGRWVTCTDRPLALSQQFAVNQIMRDHGSSQPGVFAVNGPPGTGKTTMLRDLIAAIVVQRAIALTSLSSPEHAFTGEPIRWNAEKYPHRITRLNPALTGYEIVVASSNNAAVENVTSQIPGPDGIDEQWREAAGAVDYFMATAEKVTGDGAWALAAAVLGNSENRGAFVTNFWFGGSRRRGARTGSGMVDVLNASAEVPDWHGAVSEFHRSLAKVRALSSERTMVSRHITTLSKSRGEQDQATVAVRQAVAERARLEVGRPSLAAQYDAAATGRQEVEDDFRTHQLKRPGLLSSRGARREWSAAHQTLNEALRHATERQRAAWHPLSQLDAQIDSWRNTERGARATLRKSDAAVYNSQSAIEGARERWGKRIPDGEEYAVTARRDLIEVRELSAPWADEEFSSARTELFLSALALHKAFILAVGRRMRDNLNALMDILDGKGRPEDPAATQAAWQTLFLVVPVVSSTFASFGRLFAGMGRESLGWLLVDEAGQAAPQNAAGAVWRTRIAVIVGDPLQLEPVVALPWGGQRALAREFGASEEWAPSRSSVQQIADRRAAVGTQLPGPAGDVWVGAPLRVHRRCDRPMFEVSNQIAYHGLMVFGTPQDREPFHGENAWCDVRSSISDGHWIPAEGEMLRKVLMGMRDAGVPAKEIRVISPFHEAAEKAMEIHGEVFPDIKDDERDQWVGTVHRMQGREADAVVIILGGDPRKPGARRFARDAPNLLNVAVTRARRRLYVIGNHESWGGERYFAEFEDVAELRHYRPASDAPRTGR